MKKLLVLLKLALLSQKTVSSIMPELLIPSNFNKNRFDNYYNDISSNSGNHSCGHISFKNFYPPEYILKKIKNPPFDTWFCLHSVDIIHNGYGPGKILTEKIYFDKKTKSWKKKKYNLNREETQNSLKIYGIENLKKLQPLELYNIHSVNASGYVVINRNISLREKEKGIKTKLSFCLIRDDAAFCGSGSMINLVDGKEIDFTPYMIKSLETVEMGLPKINNNL